MLESPASGVKFVHLGNGLQLLKVALQTHIDKAENDDVCALIVNCVIRDILVSPDTLLETSQVVHGLEHALFPLLVRSFKIHLSNSEIVCNILKSIYGVVGVTLKSSNELPALVREAVRLHPSMRELQFIGDLVLSSTFSS